MIILKPLGSVQYSVWASFWHTNFDVAYSNPELVDHCFDEKYYFKEHWAGG